MSVTSLFVLEKNYAADKRLKTDTRQRLSNPGRRSYLYGEPGGQRAKLMLLSLTISGAEVLLMDEPTRNFSPLSGPVIRNMLAGFPGAIISISHDRKFIDEVADKVYELTPEGLIAVK